MAGAPEVLAAIFDEAAEHLRVYAEAEPEECDLQQLLDGLQAIREGEFDLERMTLFEIWDALGVAERSGHLDKLYVMLGMMNDIRSFPPQSHPKNGQPT